MATSKRITCVCVGCSVTFSVFQSAFKRGEGRYCSKACFETYRPRMPIADRFWSYVEKTEECWLWQGHCASNGYGQFMMKKSQPCLAHRMVYELTYGEIPAGLIVCHHCDNPPCVKPEHLFLGTYSDNMQDMIRKGRSIDQTHPEKHARGDSHGARLHPEKLARGISHYKAKLTDDQVRDMRRLRDVEKWELKRLAVHFGVSVGTVGKVCNRQVWKHVD